MAYGIPNEREKASPAEEDFFQPCYGPIIEEVGKTPVKESDGSAGGDGKGHWSGH